RLLCRLRSASPSRQVAPAGMGLRRYLVGVSRARARAVADRLVRTTVRGFHPESRSGRQPRDPGARELVDERGATADRRRLVADFSVRADALPGRRMEREHAISILHRSRRSGARSACERRTPKRVRGVRMEARRSSRFPEYRYFRALEARLA